MSDVQKFGEEFQRVGKDGFDASVRSVGEVNKGFQAIAATVTDYSKKAFEDGTRAFQQLTGAKSFANERAQIAHHGFHPLVEHMGIDLRR